MNYFILNKDIHGQGVSLMLPKRDYKPSSVFSEGLLQASVKFRSLQTCYYILFSRKLNWPHFEQIMENWRREKITFTFILNYDEDSDNENNLSRCKQMGTFTFRKEENWAHPCRLQKSKQELLVYLVPSALTKRCINSIRREGEYRKATEAKTSGVRCLFSPLQQKSTPLTLQKMLCTQPGKQALVSTHSGLAPG